MPFGIHWYTKEHQSTSTSYLKVKQSSDVDEWYTTNDMVDRILPYIPDFSTVWCPFDKEDSNFVRRFTEAGINVIFSHIDDGQDFFEYEPSEHYDYIISNPPFSRKDDVFERLFALKKPFAMVMSMNNIFDSKRRYAMFSSNDFEILVPHGRTKFIRGGATAESMYAPPFQSVYVCHDMLPKQIVFTE